MKTPHIYALIIGTEILNGRREDAHFVFLRDALAKHRHALKALFVIDDDPAFIEETIRFVAKDKDAVLFSFGGIGATPDDHTRLAAAKALRDGKLYEHPEAKRIIEERLGKEAYPYPIKMAQLPKGAKLLHNPINRMPAFYLDDRYFFMPGFPEMSHPMVTHILTHIIPDGKQTYRFTLTAACKENLFIELMQKVPEGVEVSSLPKITEAGFEATLSVSGHDKETLKRYFRQFTALLDKKAVDYRIEED